MVPSEVELGLGVDIAEGGGDPTFEPLRSSVNLKQSYRP